jgi:hypothetical protein
MNLMKGAEKFPNQQCCFVDPHRGLTNQHRGFVDSQ